MGIGKERKGLVKRIACNKKEYRETKSDTVIYI